MPSFSLVTQDGTAAGLPYKARGASYLLEAIVDLSVPGQSLAQNQTADIIRLPPKCLVQSLGIEAITLATATATFNIGDFGTTAPAASATHWFSATPLLSTGGAGATVGLLTLSAALNRLYTTGGIIRVTQAVNVTANSGRFRVFATVVDLK